MKLKKLMPFALIGVLLVSCGSSERVIMDDGSVYTLKKNSYYQKGKDVTETLTKEDKDLIKETRDKRLEVERLAQQRQTELKEEQEKVEKALKEARKKQETIENNKEELEAVVAAREEAREAVLKAKDKSLEQQQRYQKLKEKGKLSPIDEEKWLNKLQGLEEKVKQANEYYKTLKKS